MIIKMQGKKGQGDIYNQTEIIKTLMKDKRTGLCVVVDEYGYATYFHGQDNEAISFECPYHVVSYSDFIRDNIENVIINKEKYTNMFIENIFGLTGLVIISDLEMIDYEFKEHLISRLEDYYVKNIKANSLHTVHYVDIKLSI